MIRGKYIHLFLVFQFCIFSQLLFGMEVARKTVLDDASFYDFSAGGGLKENIQIWDFEDYVLLKDLARNVIIILFKDKASEGCDSSLIVGMNFCSASVLKKKSDITDIFHSFSPEVDRYLPDFAQVEVLEFPCSKPYVIVTSQMRGKIIPFRGRVEQGVEELVRACVTFIGVFEYKIKVYPNTGKNTLIERVFKVTKHYDGLEGEMGDLRIR